MTGANGLTMGLAPMIAALLAGGGFAGWWFLWRRSPGSASANAESTTIPESSNVRRVMELERRVATLEEALERLREQSDRGALADHREQVYAQAIRMVSRGAGTDELISLCGLSRNEAQLIAMMHGEPGASDA